MTLPADLLGVEDGAFDAGSFVVPFIWTVLTDLSDAGKADSDSACHRCFHRDLTVDGRRFADLGDFLHHDFGAASCDPNSLAFRQIRKAFGKQIRDEALLAHRTVVRAKRHVETR